MEQIVISKNMRVPNFSETEREIIKYWKERDVLAKSIKQRPESQSYTFFDGPITANNKPHYGHALTMVIKDVIPRYRAMKGFRVERSLGWDCQGIPVEYEVEKELGFQQKEDIEKFGIEKFNNLCRESVKKYQRDIRDLTERMGRWVNSDEEYATMDSWYIESVWWSLKELYKRDLLYEGYKVVPYSTRAGSTLSNSEVALGGYESVLDPAVVVKLKLRDEDTYLLIWTTTPWTLPGNLLVAVGKNYEYVKVRYKNEQYIVGKDLVQDIFKKDYEIVSTVKGSELIGKEYEPLYPYYREKAKEGAFTIVHADHVTLEEGTGLVHQAPYGEEDFLLMSDMGIGMFDYLDDQGSMKEEITDFAGMFYRKANKYIVQDLKKRNLLLKEYDYEHQMPMCWRTNTPLIYKPIKSWYIKVSEIRDMLVKENMDINWVPAHVKEGRFGNWLSEARDWALSRNRYWGTPLPIWVCDKCGRRDVMGSLKEVYEKSGVKLEDPHKPFVDKIVYGCSECNGQMKRVNDVIDVWYDSGAMPFARLHYPFKNEELFKKKYPAEFIAEGVDQTRGWFYTLHVLGVALFKEKAFRNVIVNGMALAPDGAKMSKSKRNYPEVNSVIEERGADSLRLHFLSSPIVHGEEVIFSEQALKEVTSVVLLPFVNSVKYFLNYRDQSGWVPSNELKLEHIMDRWIVSKLNYTIKSVTEYMDSYRLMKATKEIFELIEILSKWYIRRSRERFVNGDLEALNTLYYVLVEISKLLAPFAPFVSESAYLTLTAGELKESVHLEDYPIFESKLLDEDLLKNMNTVREICSLGLNIRDENRIKLRQPLSKAYISIPDKEMLEIVKGELNVKKVEYSKKKVDKKDHITHEMGDIFVTMDLSITKELAEEGMVNEIVRGLQLARKERGCEMGEYVSIRYHSEDKEIIEVIKKHRENLKESIHLKEIKQVDRIDDGKRINVNENFLVIDIVK